MVDPVPPTRKEIESISRESPRFKNGRFEPGEINLRIARALERLFQVAGELTPDDVESLSIAVAISTNIANEAVSAIDRLSDALLLAALSPKKQVLSDNISDLSPRQELGTLASQNRDNINVTGGSVDSIDITDSTLEGGAVTSDITDSTDRLIDSSTTLADGAAAAAGTLTNAPTAGDPAKWVEIDDNGTPLYIPAWT